jgi:molecular chaperone Hsp33
LDTLQKFMFENSLVRGELIEISDAWQQVQSRRTYPAVVSAIMGEMMAAAALLSANLKFDGTIIMQIHGDGPIQLLVAECDAAHLESSQLLKGRWRILVQLFCNSVNGIGHLLKGRFQKALYGLL